jgi:heme/copper-type cytochrome/quinol oxidase subunit 2
LHMLIAVIVGLVAFSKPHLSHSQTKLPDHEFLDLLMANANDRAALVITVQFENGIYAMRYDMRNGVSACPRGGDLVVPLGTVTDINVSSNDKIVRWTIPEAGFDVTAIPGRIENARVSPTKRGRYQVKPPPGNLDKISDVPMNVMTAAEFQLWFKQSKRCPQG